MIAREVRALRKYRKKGFHDETLVPKDEEYILALMHKVKPEQASPGYEYYSPPKYYYVDNNPISFEIFVLFKI